MTDDARDVAAHVGASGSFGLGPFVAGSENRLAAATVERFLEIFRRAPASTNGDGAIADGNGPAEAESLAHLSPVVFHGVPGTGKSHLVHGLVAGWKQNRPDDNVVLLTAAEFAQQYAEAVEKWAVTSWRGRFRTADLFVLEDLLHLSTKPAAQGELLHTLDELADHGGFVFLTSRLSPHELTNFLPALTSRLQAGLCVPLVVPELEARRKILGLLCATRQLPLSDSSLRLLARSLPMSVPELSGVLANMALAAKSSGNTLDDRFVQGYLARHCAARHPPLRTIAAHTARHFGLRVAELRSGSRRRGVVLARDVAMYLSRQLTSKSLKQIGEHFGGRDHTTVLHGCRKTEALLNTDQATLEAVTTLRRSLASG